MRVGKYTPLLIFLIGFNLAHAEIGSLVFSTGEQSIGTSEISEKLTVNSGEAPGETSDLYLSSTSGTGEFSSSNTTWEAATKLTWNSNWSNRSFYYKDSTSGKHTLTAKLVGRTSGATYTAMQSITVGGDSQSGGDVLGTTTQSVSSDVPHSGGGSLPEEESSSFSIKIGKNRSALKGVPVYFTSVVSPKSAESGTSITWSFGDATIGSGAAVHHAYSLPGQYVVVARASNENEFATARVIVTVSELSLEISGARAGSEGFISLKNTSRDDAVVSNFAINRRDQIFRFPQDMTILARSELKLHNRVTGLNPTQGDTFYLRDASGYVLNAYEFLPELPAEPEPTLAVAAVVPALPKLMVPEITLASYRERSISIATTSATTAPAIVATRTANRIVIERKSNIFSMLLSLPRRIINEIF